MGCDIHIYVERKINNAWIAVKGENPWIKQYQDWADKAGDEGRKTYLLKCVKKMEQQESEVLEGWIYVGRNYNLFSILADVRNDFNVKPISNPRGLPKNLSCDVKNASECADGHSHSYYTFKELLDYDWDNNYIENEGYVSEEVYKNFISIGNPYPYCKDVDGGNVKKVSNCVMDRILKNKYPWEQNKSFYTVVRWRESFKEVAKGLLDNINNFIFKNNITDLENYRIVFWFDN